MRIAKIAIVTLLAAPLATAEVNPTAHSSYAAKHTTMGMSELGTKSAPATVEISKVPGLDISSVPTLRVESTDRTPPRETNYRSPEWVVAEATAALSVITLLLATATFALYRATVSLSRDAKESAEQQIQRMERSIKQAARAARAMETLAEATTTNTALMPTLLRRQMRAYLSVETGQADYQNADNRFAVALVITNNGLTPAKNVRHVALVGIIDGKDAVTTEFPPVGEPPENSTGIAARQSFRTALVIMPDRVPDAEVATIMEGSTRRLFCWGIVKYDDVYGEHWETKFCLNYTFFTGEDQKVRFNSWNYSRHHDST